MSSRALIALTTTEAESNAEVAGPVPAPASGKNFDDLGALSLHASPPGVLRQSQSRHRRLLVAADVVSLTLALVTLLSPFGLRLTATVTLIAVPVLVLLLELSGLYDHEDVRLRHTTLDEAPRLLQLTGLVALGLAILRPASGADSIRGAQIALLWAVSFSALVCGRVIARAVSRRVVDVERCLVIGDLGLADRFARRLIASRARAEIIACVAAEDLVDADRPEVRADGPEAIRELVHELGIHRIIIAPGAESGDGAVDLIRAAKAIGVRVSVMPRILQVVGSSTTFDEVEGMSLLGVPQFGLSPAARALKRAMDLVATSAAVIVLSPILLAIAAAIKLDSDGPVFFRQVRVGRDGRHFSILKFRSMVVDAEQRREDLRLLSIAGDGLFKVEDDPRVTRVGRILRRASLDELPQLFNVLRGEMSLVGPRPLITEEDAQILGLDRSRLRLTPGMTGPWQLLGSRVPLDEMVEIDYLYASQWSLWLDFKLLLRTVLHVARLDNM